MCSWYFDKQNLKLRWINARWRLHLLNDDQWRARVENAKKYIKTISKIYLKTFDDCVTGDEIFLAKKY